MRWIEISLEVPRSDLEAAGDCLLRCCPSGLCEDKARGGSRRILRAYLPCTRAGRAALTRLWRELERRVGSAAPATRVVDDADWTGAWHRYARPVRVGRLVVTPTRTRPQALPGQVLVRLDAGQAFGSGEHPTTRLCLAAVERHVTGGETVLDLGTGSGILGIAAARLGARRVLAIDDDPIATSVARANARANGVAHSVTVRRARGLGRVRLRADLIVANLTAELLVGVLPHVVRCLAPGGRFVGSGFGRARVAEVSRLVKAAGLRLGRIEALRGWCAVHAVRGVARRS